MNRIELDRYPIITTLAVPVTFKGVRLEVRVKGRAFILPEEDGWSILGVEPAGLTAFGETPVETWDGFKVINREMVEDAAEKATSREEFERILGEYVSQRSEAAVDYWEMARLAIRENRAELHPALEGLNRDTSPVDTGCSVKDPEDLSFGELEIHIGAAA